MRAVAAALFVASVTGCELITSVPDDSTSNLEGGSPSVGGGGAGVFVAGFCP